MSDKYQAKAQREQIAEAIKTIEDNGRPHLVPAVLPKAEGFRVMSCCGVEDRSSLAALISSAVGAIYGSEEVGEAISAILAFADFKAGRFDTEMVQ